MAQDANALLLKRAISFGYNSKLVDAFGGLCYGTGLRWLESQFLNQQALFTQRIQDIIDDQTLAPKITQLKERVSKLPVGEKPSSEDIDLFEVLGFFESVILYQSPEKHRNIFTQNIKQHDIESVSKFAASDAIFKSGGLVSIYSETGLYTLDAFEAYLYEIEERIHTITPSVSSKVGFLISACKHAICMCYDPVSRQWSAMNINQWPPLEQQNASAITQYVHSGFQAVAKSDLSPFAMNVQLITTTDNPSLVALQMEFAELKKCHPLSEEAKHSSALLNMAIKYDHRDLIVSLLDNGIPVNSSDYGISPLSIAAQSGHQHIVSLLINTYGADKNYKDDNMLALHHAARHGDVKIVHMLADVQNINTLDSLKRTPLFYAVEEGHLDVVQGLVQYKPVLNQTDKQGETPLLVAVKEGFFDIMEVLLALGAKPDISDLRGTTPLIMAAQQGRLDMVTKLLEFGAEPNIAMQSYGLTIRQGYMLQYLNTDKGATALYIAAQEGHTNVVIYLTEHGADINQPVNNGLTPLCIAIKKGQIQTAIALLQRHANINTPQQGTILEMAINLNRVEIIKYLAEQGININEMINGQTPLFLAALNGRLEIVQLLLQNDNSAINIPFITNKWDLQNFVASDNEEIKQRMEAFIDSQLKNSENKYSAISILPVQIAAIMGRDKIADYLIHFEPNNAHVNNKPASQNTEAEDNTIEDKTADSNSQDTTELRAVKKIQRAIRVKLNLNKIKSNENTSNISEDSDNREQVDLTNLKKINSNNPN